MADNRAVQLLTASFKGVTFSVRSESVTETGRKLVLHEYVNSSERFIEDQGQIPPKLTLRAFVHGADFIARARRLEQVLNEPGPGLLSAPTFGVFSVYAGAYLKDASQQSVGEISYTIPFFAGRPAPGPSQTLSSIEDVYQFGDDARAAVETVFGASYPAPVDAANAQAGVGDLNNVLKNIEDTIKTILPSEDLGEIQRIIPSIKLDGARLIRDPVSLAAKVFSGTPQLAGIWQHISLGLSVAEAIDEGIAELSSLTSLGGGLTLPINDINRSVKIDVTDTDIPIWPETTAQRILRNDARLALVHACRVSALVNLYEVAAAKSYTTDDEIDETRSSIEDLHERIMRTETHDYDLIQSNPAVRTAVEDIRLAALEVLGQKQQESFEIDTDITNAPTSVFVRSHLLYAEEFTNSEDLGTRAAQLSNLNSDQPSISLTGDFKIFQV